MLKPIHELEKSHVSRYDCEATGLGPMLDKVSESPRDSAMGIACAQHWSRGPRVFWVDSWYEYALFSTAKLGSVHGQQSDEPQNFLPAFSTVLTTSAYLIPRA